MPPREFWRTPAAILASAGPWEVHEAATLPGKLAISKRVRISACAARPERECLRPIHAKQAGSPSRALNVAPVQSRDKASPAPTFLAFSGRALKLLERQPRPPTVAPSWPNPQSLAKYSASFVSEYVGTVAQGLTFPVQWRSAQPHG